MGSILFNNRDQLKTLMTGLLKRVFGEHDFSSSELIKKGQVKVFETPVYLVSKINTFIRSQKEVKSFLPALKKDSRGQ